MPGTDGQPHWLTDEEQQAWRATVQLSQCLLAKVLELDPVTRPLARDRCRGLIDRDAQIVSYNRKRFQVSVRRNVDMEHGLSPLREDAG